jgi:hypothetical protein
MNEARYNQKLRELSEIDPNNRFLALLRGGYSAVNVIYLERALLGVPSVVSRVPASPITQKSKPKTQNLDLGVNEEFVKPTDLMISADNEVLMELDLQRRALYAQLFTERKKFFDFAFTPQYNRERAKVSDVVQGIQGRIKALKERVDHYLETGKLVEVSDDGAADAEFVIPEDPYKRMQKVNSLRSSISRAQREWRTLVAIDAERAAEKEKSILYLKGCLAKVFQAIDGK